METMTLRIGEKVRAYFKAGLNVIDQPYINRLERGEPNRPIKPVIRAAVNRLIEVKGLDPAMLRRDFAPVDRVWFMSVREQAGENRKAVAGRPFAAMLNTLSDHGGLYVDGYVVAVEEVEGKPARFALADGPDKQADRKDRTCWLSMDQVALLAAPDEAVAIEPPCAPELMVEPEPQEPEAVINAAEGETAEGAPAPAEDNGTPSAEELGGGDSPAQVEPILLADSACRIEIVPVGAEPGLDGDVITGEWALLLGGTRLMQAGFAEITQGLAANLIAALQPPPAAAPAEIAPFESALAIREVVRHAFARAPKRPPLRVEGGYMETCFDEVSFRARSDMEDGCYTVSPSGFITERHAEPAAPEFPDDAPFVDLVDSLVPLRLAAECASADPAQGFRSMVCMRVDKPGCLEIFGGSGHRFATHTVAAPALRERCTYMIPRNVIMAAVADPNAVSVRIFFGDGVVALDNGNVKIASRSFERESYPDVQAFIPQKTDTAIVFDRRALSDALAELVPYVRPDTELVEFSLSADGCRMRAAQKPGHKPKVVVVEARIGRGHSVDPANLGVLMPINYKGKKPDDVHMAFSLSYLRAYADLIETPSLEIAGGDPEKPFIVTGVAAA